MKFSNITNILAFSFLSFKSANAFAPPNTQVPASQISSKTTDTSTQLYDLAKLAQKTPYDEEVRRLIGYYGERSRTTRRNVYSAADWIYARRSDRIVKHSHWLANW